MNDKEKPDNKPEDVNELGLNEKEQDFLDGMGGVYDDPNFLDRMRAKLEKEGKKAPE